MHFVFVEVGTGSTHDFPLSTTNVVIYVIKLCVRVMYV